MKLRNGEIKPRMRVRKGKLYTLFMVISIALLALVSFVSVLPFLIVLSGSFTANSTILHEGFSLIPKVFSTEAYDTIFKYPDGILQAYKMTAYYTAVGTGVGLISITLTGYVLSRRDFKYRNTVSFLIYFTSIFGGGIIPWYLMYANVLGLKGTTLAIWFPALMNPFLIILMRTFITTTVPDALTEAAKIDGASHLTIFSRVVLPLLKPALATVGLFLALGYWNDWYRSSMFSTSSETWELQFYLYDMVNASTAMKEMAQSAGLSAANTAALPTQSVKMAMAVVVTGPILLLYPFVQRYFISGITVGAVKG